MEQISGARTAHHAKNFRPEYIQSASRQGSIDLKWDEDKNKLADKAMQEAIERRRRGAPTRGR